MKCRKIAVLIIALSMVTLAFVSIAVAHVTKDPGITSLNADYFGIARGGRVEDTNTIIITLSNFVTSSNLPQFDGTLAHDIMVTVYTERGSPGKPLFIPLTYTVDATKISATADTITLTLTVPMDIFPDVSYSHIVGYVGTDGTSDPTFYAAGPGWGWSNIH